MSIIFNVIGVALGLTTAFVRGAIAALVNDRPRNVHLGESRMSGAATWAWIVVYAVATLLCSAGGHVRIAAALTLVTALMLARRVAGRVGVPIPLTQLASEFSGSANQSAAWFFTVLYAIVPVSLAVIADKHIAVVSTVAGVLATWGPLLYIAYAGLVGHRIAKRALAHAQRVDADARRASVALGGSPAEILAMPRFSYLTNGTIVIAPPLPVMVERLNADRGAVEARVASQWPHLTVDPLSDHLAIRLVPANQDLLDERRALAESGGVFASDLDAVEVPGPRIEYEPATQPVEQWAMTAEDFQ